MILPDNTLRWLVLPLVFRVSLFDVNKQPLSLTLSFFLLLLIYYILICNCSSRILSRHEQELDVATKIKASQQQEIKDGNNSLEFVSWKFAFKVVKFYILVSHFK